MSTGNPTQAQTMLANGGIANLLDSSTNDLLLNHCWVKVTVSGTDYAFDPTMKSYTYVSSQNIASLMGYNRATFLSRANSGSTLTSDYVQNINDANINNDLNQFATSLTNWIETNDYSASLDDIVGGRTIVPAAFPPVLQTDLPYHDTSYTTITTNVIPTNYKAKLRFQYDETSTPGVYNVDYTFNSADIYGKRLTLWFDGSLVARLRLNGTVYGNPSSAQTSGTFKNAKITVTHPYPTTFANAEQLVPIQAGAQTTIGATWAATSRQMAAVHQEAQNNAIASGAAAGDESLLGQSLLLVWDNFTGQMTSGMDLLDRLCSSKNVVHHVIGTIGQVPYGTGQVKLLNSFLAGFSVSALAPTTDVTSIGFADSLLIQSLESAAHEQVSGVVAGDTIKAIAKCNLSGIKIYDAKSSNWSTGTNVRSIMSAVGYSNDVLNTIQNTYINATPSWRVVLPETFNITFGSLSNFYAFLALSPNGSGMFGQTWFGAKGAVSGAYQNDASTNAASADNARQANSFGMPLSDARATSGINLTNGRYEYSSQDISVGNQGAPYELQFQRYYNSALRLTLQDMGFGWSHNWQIKATVNSEGFLPFGEQQVRAATAAIAALFVSRDVALSDASMPVNNVVITSIVQEFLVSQLTNNIVRLQFGNSVSLFTKLADGRYLPPLGNSDASTLTKNTANQFVFTTPNKVVYTYRTSGQVDTIAYPFGITLTFSYNSSGKISSVTNGFRTLSFSYDAFNQLASVSDGNGRSVVLTISSTTGNLTSVADPLGKNTTYSYDQRGRLTQIFRPANPSTAIFTNVYDSLSRVKEQTDAFGNVWQFYFAGSRSEEVAPNSTSRVIYLNEFGSKTIEINALNQKTQYGYDGLQRVLSVTYPEGNSVEKTYDNRNNLLTSTQHPKPASGLTSRTTSFTYETDWNKVKTVTDTAGQTTVVTYASAGQNGASLITQVQEPTVAAGTPVSSYGYNARGQMSSYTDPTGVQTTYNYNSTTANMSSMTLDPSGLNISSSLAYDAIGNLTGQTDAKGVSALTASYNNNRQITQVVRLPTNQTELLTYDDNGNRTRYRSLVSTDSNSQEFVASYAVDDRLLSLVGPSNAPQGSQPVPIKYEYDSLRRPKTVIDPLGRKAIPQYDALSRTISLQVEQQTIYELGYSVNGYVVSQKDARGYETAYAYDGFDRPILTTFPDTRTTSQVFDVRDNVTQFTSRAGNSTYYSFDALNQLTSESPSGQPTVTLTYDLAGRTRTVSVPIVPGDSYSGTYTLNYDTAGRMVEEVYPDGKSILATLDKNFNVQGLTYPSGGAITLGYDQVNRLTSVAGFGASSAFQYDSASRISGQTNANNTGHGYRYDLQDNLLALTIGGVKSSTSIELTNPIQFAYSRNPTGQVASKQCNLESLMWEPTVDKLVSYGTANSFNQYPSVGANSFSYNLDGCLTSDGVNSYTYDSENRLLSVSGPSGNVTFKYDPFGRLIRKISSTSSVQYYYSGPNRVEEVVSSTGSRSAAYVYSALDSCVFTINASSLPNYLHYDETGSVILVSDAVGQAVQKTVYDAWGTRKAGSFSALSIGFTGQFYAEEAGLYYYKARFYSPDLGRFLQPDPDPSADTNLYNYVYNDPSNLTDPFGLNPFLLGASTFSFGGLFSSVNSYLGPLYAGFAGLPFFFGGFSGFGALSPAAASSYAAPAAAMSTVLLPLAPPPPPPYLAQSAVIGLLEEAGGAIAAGAAGVSAATLGTGILVTGLTIVALNDLPNAFSRIQKNSEQLFRPQTGVHGNDLESPEPSYVYVILAPPGTNSPFGPIPRSGVYKYGIGSTKDSGYRFISQLARLRAGYSRSYYGFVIAHYDNRIKAYIHEQQLIETHELAFGAKPPGNR